MQTCRTNSSAGSVTPAQVKHWGKKLYWGLHHTLTTHNEPVMVWPLLLLFELLKSCGNGCIIYFLLHYHNSMTADTTINYGWGLPSEVHTCTHTHAHTNVYTQSHMIIQTDYWVKLLFEQTAAEAFKYSLKPGGCDSSAVRYCDVGIDTLNL